jgi:hypothetical protein
MPSGVYRHKQRDRTCSHADRPYCSRGMCKSCYDAWYRQQNMADVKDYQKKHYGLTKAQLLGYHAAETRKQREKDKLQALALHSLKGEICCSHPDCDVTDPDMLTLDHVENDGRTRRAMGEGRGNGLYRRASKATISGLQTLCANHNLKKEVLRRRGVSEKN